MCSSNTFHSFKAFMSNTEEPNNQLVSPLLPDNINCDYFLKQSTFITNHFFEARNEFFNIVRNTSFAYEKKYCNKSTLCSNSSVLRDNENYKSIVCKIENVNTIKSCVMSQKSKLKKKSKHIKKMYFLTKELTFTYTNFIPSSFIRTMFLKVRKMKYANYFKSRKKYKDNQLTEKNPKVVVEKASASSICFGTIAALSDLGNEDELDVAIDNYCNEVLISNSENYDNKFDLTHNDICNQFESNYVHAILDKNLNVLPLENENLFLNCMRKNESHSLKKLKFHRNGYKLVHAAKIKSQKNSSVMLGSSRPLRIKKKHFPDFILKENIKRSKGKRQKDVIDLELLKKDILDGKGPVATVVLKRLSDEYIRKSLSKAYHKRNYLKKTLVSSTGIGDYRKPAYILSGSGTKLKNIPGVEDNVQNASKRTIRLIHHVLFGTTEKDHLSRMNILEFNGYCLLQKGFIAHSIKFLKKMSHTVIRAMCKTLLVNVKGCSEVVTVERLFQFLQAPSAISEISSEKVQLSPVKLKNTSNSHPNHSVKSAIEINHSNSTEVSHQSFGIKPSLKLQNLEKICFNIECAAPEDLIELSDLLFIKPCDSTEIHSKILDFTYFSFNESSIEYHYRKTLLNYMNFNILKKIAVLLDIPHSENSNHPELSNDIFTFLMEPKQKNTNSKSRNESSEIENNSSNVNESKSSNIMESRASNVIAKKSPRVARNQTLIGAETKMNNVFVNIKPNAVTSKAHNIEFQLNQASKVESESAMPSSQCSDHDYSMSCADEDTQETNNSVLKKLLNGEELKFDRNIPFLVHTRNFVKESAISRNSNIDSKKNLSNRFHPYYGSTGSSTAVLNQVINKKPVVKLTRFPLITRVQAT